VFQLSKKRSVSTYNKRSVSIFNPQAMLRGLSQQSCEQIEAIQPSTNKALQPSTRVSSKHASANTAGRSAYLKSKKAVTFKGDGSLKEKL
jgi:hypothetical protein